MSDSTKTNGKPALRRIAGNANLFTFDNIIRNPKDEKKVIARIVREAKKLRTQIFVQKRV